MRPYMRRNGERRITGREMERERGKRRRGGQKSWKCSCHMEQLMSNVISVMQESYGALCDTAPHSSASKIALHNKICIRTLVEMV